MNNNLPHIIGLVARSRRGKDTVADYICDRYPEFNYKNIKLSKPVKDVAKILYGFSYQQLEGNEKEIIDPRWNITPRDAMVYITTAFMTRHGPDFFSKKIFSDFDDAALSDTPKHIIITDVRYENDISEIIKRNGIVIKIIRDTEPYHSWENNIDNLEASYTIYNNSTLDDLYAQINTII